jgi:hypothetical protein
MPNPNDKLGPKTDMAILTLRLAHLVEIAQLSLQGKIHDNKRQSAIPPSKIIGRLHH